MNFEIVEVLASEKPFSHSVICFYFYTKTALRYPFK